MLTAAEYFAKRLLHVAAMDQVLIIAGEQVTEFSKELRMYSWRDMVERLYAVATNTAVETKGISVVLATQGTAY